MKISLIAAFMLFVFGESHAQNRYIVKENNDGKLTYALVNPKGVELKTFVHFSEVETADGITLAVDNSVGKTGYLDNNGDWIVPPTYSSIWFSNFKNGYAVVYDNNRKVERCAVINLKNEVVIPFEERILYPYNDGWFAYYNKNNKEKGYVNLKNEKMKGIDFEKCASFSNGKAAITDKKDKSYYINTKGKPLFNQTFKKVSSFNEGYAIVQERGNQADFFVLINDKGEKKATIYERYIDNIAPFANGWIKLFDTKSDEYTFSNALKSPTKQHEGKGESNTLFSDGLAATIKGYIDEKGTIVVPIKHKIWREEQAFAYGTAVIFVYDVENQEIGVYHLINKKGETLWQSKKVKL